MARIKLVSRNKVVVFNQERSFTSEGSLRQRIKELAWRHFKEMPLFRSGICVYIDNKKISETDTIHFPVKEVIVLHYILEREGDVFLEHIGNITKKYGVIESMEWT